MGTFLFGLVLIVQRVSVNGQTIVPKAIPAGVGESYSMQAQQIEKLNIGKGWYKLTVTNKGTLVNGSQAYTLMIRGARKALFV